MSDLQQDFFYACKQGNFDKMKELYENNDIDISNSAAFRHACGYGHFEIAKYLWDKNMKNPEEKQFDINYKESNAFHFSCLHGHLPIVEWLFNLGGSKCIKLEIIGLAVVRKGNADILQWLYKNKIDLNWKDNIMFKEAYTNNRSTIVEWMIKTNKFSSIMPWIASKNDLDMIKKLLSIGDVDDCYIDNSIYEVCKSGNTEIYDYLHSIRHNRLFRNACRNNNIIMAKYLYDTKLINRRAKSFTTLIKIVQKCKYTELYEWLNNEQQQYYKDLIGDIVTTDDDSYDNS